MSGTIDDLVRRAAAEHLTSRRASELLARFAATQDADAFAGLVHQFGPLVLGTCRRVLGPDADDAFQGVFFALARHAGRVRDSAALPAWLHRVSLRISHKALARRRVVVPLPDTPADSTDPFADVAWKDVRRVLDEELDRLPEKYRGAVILCWLDGATQDEAAKRLGVSLNTLKRRLDAGREILRGRLIRRGVTPVLAAVAVLGPVDARATVPGALLDAACRMAVGVRPAVGVGTVKLLASVMVVAGVAIGVAASGPPTAGVAVAPHPTVDSTAAVVAPEPTDEPLPAGATTRFGSTKFRTPDFSSASALSPDGTLLAVDGNSIRVYEAANWKHVRTLPVDEGVLVHTHHLAFSPDGRFLAASNTQFAHIWDVKSGKLLQRFDGGEEWRWNTFCAFTADGHFALADKHRLYFYEPTTGREVRSVAVAGRVIAVSPDGSVFVRLADKDDPVKLVLGDAKTGKDVHRFEPLFRWTKHNHGVAFSPDGKLLTLLPASGKELQLWDVAARKLVKSFALPDEGDTHGRAGPVAALPSMRAGAAPARVGHQVER